MDIDRYNYVPALSTVTIRIPGLIHAQMIFKTSSKMKKGLDNVVHSLTPHDGVLASLLSKIELSDSANFSSPFDPHHSRSPDQQLHHFGFLRPRLNNRAFTFTQQPRNLDQVAHDTILVTEGNVRMVIGIEIDGNRQKKDEVVDRILFWESTVSGTPPGLSSICTFDEVSLQSRPLF